MFTKSPEMGGQISDQGSLTPQRFAGGGELLPDSPESLNIEDRRAEAEEIGAALIAAMQAAFGQIQQMGTEAFAAIAAAAQEAANSIATAFGQLGETISALGAQVAEPPFVQTYLTAIETVKTAFAIYAR